MNNNMATYETILRIINPYVDMWSRIGHIRTLCWHIKSNCAIWTICCHLESYCAIWAICGYMEPFCTMQTMCQRSSLENYASNNTRQQETTRHNTSTTRVQHDTALDNTIKTQDNTRQHEYSTIQHEYKGNSGSKNRALLHIFCYWTIIFLMSFRNG